MVSTKNVRIEWTLLAKEDMREVLNYYKQKSLIGYNLVKDAILEAIISASKSPEIFKADNLKKDNNGNIRVFTVYHTRVAYEITDYGILVLRLRHTSREPQEY